MARPNTGRTINEEANLAQRVQHEREGRGWSYETLARKLTDAGCKMNGSALYKIEKGAPPRRITVDELVAFSRIFEISIEDLLTPMEIYRKERAKEIAQARDRGTELLAEAVAALLTANTNMFELAVDDQELMEYVMNQWFAPDPDTGGGDSPTPMFHLEVDGKEVPVDDSLVRTATRDLFLAISAQAEANVYAMFPHLGPKEEK